MSQKTLIKQKWQTKKLSDLCQIELGKTPYRGNSKFWDVEKKTNNVWLSIADLSNTEDNVIIDSKEYISDEAAKLSKIVKKHTLLVSFKLTLGRLAFTGKDLYTNEAIAALTINDEELFSKKYLYYYLSSIDWHRMAEGDIKVKGKTLNKAKLKEIEVCYPESLEEQQRIVSILDKAFVEIDKAKKNAEQNLKNAREIFESYLHRLEGKKEPLGLFVDITTGKLDANAAKEDGQYPFFTCSREIFSIDKFAFDCEAILLAGNNAVGDFNVKHYRGKFNAYQRTYVITINNESNLIYRYLYFQLLQSLKEFKIKSVGAGTKFLKIGMIKELKIILPSVHEQEQIMTKLDALNEETKALEEICKQKLTALEELKKSILNKAFKGEL